MSIVRWLDILNLTIMNARLLKQDYSVDKLFEKVMKSTELGNINKLIEIFINAHYANVLNDVLDFCKKSGLVSKTVVT